VGWAWQEAKRLVEHEAERAERLKQKEAAAREKERQRLKQLEWQRNQQRVDATKKKKLDAAEERLFLKAKRMEELDKSVDKSVAVHLSRAG
jgi:hypothetical protein